MLQLSKRLQQIADQVPVGARVADIGTDHAYLPIYLVQAGKSPFCIGVEMNEGPYRRACLEVEEENLTENISIRRGDGLRPVRAGEADVITISGMGGSLIQHILAEGLDKIKGAKRTILQPNVGAPLIRRFGYERGLKLVHEEIVGEGKEYYEILTFEPGDGRIPYLKDPLPFQGVEEILSFQWMFGPYLLRQGGEAFVRKWQEEREKVKKILLSMEKGESDQVAKKRREFEIQLKWIEEVLRKCNLSR